MTKRCVFNQPGCLLDYAKLPLQLKTRHRVLALRHQIDGEKPLREIQFGVLEDRGHNGGALVAAIKTLPNTTTVKALRLMSAAASHTSPLRSQRLRCRGS